MKKTVLVFFMTVLLLIGGISVVTAQEQPAPKKDTVNIDTEAKPETYYEVEDEATDKGSANGNTTTIAIIAGAVVLAGAIVVILMKKKK